MGPAPTAEGDGAPGAVLRDRLALRRDPVRPVRLTPFRAAQAVAGAVAVARIARGATRLAPLEPLAGVAPAGAVSVVVPARDEERRIGPCLAALGADPQVGEVVVVDDESTDATADVARRHGARVVAGRPLPPGWVGKPWALQQGLEAATGDWVLALDADVRPRPGLVGAALAAVARHGLDLATVAPRFVCDTPGQQVLHPALLATLLYRFGPPGTRRPPPARRLVANGQCLVVRREWLAGRGGFAPAGSHLTDDVALARALAAGGARVGFLDGARLLDVKMHESAAEAWREWGRSLPMADVTSPAAQAADLAVVWLAQALPLVRLAARRSSALDLALVALRLGVVVALAGSYRPPRPWVWLSPLADAPAAARLTWGALRPATTWRGRTYARRHRLAPPGAAATSLGWGSALLAGTSWWVRRGAAGAGVSAATRPGRPWRSAGR